MKNFSQSVLLLAALCLPVLAGDIGSVGYAEPPPPCTIDCPPTVSAADDSITDEALMILLGLLLP